MEKTFVREEDAGGNTLAAGSTLGQYRIIRLLGRGGMGEVYEAENVVNRKHYALKVLPGAATASQNFVDRFRIESRVMSDLRHPHIVQVHHAGEENGLFYLTMDLVAGPEARPFTLEDRLVLGRLPEAWSRHIMLQICDAVACAHAKGIIHRDLKPSNVLIDAEGNAQVADFGLAKVVGGDYLKEVIQRGSSLSLAEKSLGDEATLGGTRSVASGDVGRRGGRPSSSARALLGTYDYMAPELRAGGDATPRADVFALGVLLYRMLTGCKPAGAYRAPSRFGASKAWDRIVHRCLEPFPADRIADAGELKRAILQGAAGRSGGLTAGVLAGALLLGGLLGGIWFVRTDSGRTPVDASPDASEDAAPPAGEPPLPATVDRGVVPVESMDIQTQARSAMKDELPKVVSSPSPVTMEHRGGMVEIRVLQPTRHETLARQKREVVEAILDALEVDYGGWNSAQRSRVFDVVNGWRPVRFRATPAAGGWMVEANYQIPEKEIMQ